MSGDWEVGNPEKVKQLFDSIAPVYDKINGTQSWGMHNRWKNYAVKALDLSDGLKVLDLCCGSGDITALILKGHYKNLKIEGVDFSENMLKIAEKRFQGVDNVNLTSCDALNLPFEDNYFDRVIISFSLRNLASIEKALKEIYRVLAKPGIYVNIDFGKPDNLLFKALFRNYFGYVVPMFGKLNNKAAEYGYLLDSIDSFPPPDVLLAMMSEAGFVYNFDYDLFFKFVSVQKGFKK